MEGGRGGLEIVQTDEQACLNVPSFHSTSYSEIEIRQYGNHVKLVLRVPKGERLCHCCIVTIVTIIKHIFTKRDIWLAHQAATSIFGWTTYNIYWSVTVILTASWIYNKQRSIYKRSTRAESKRLMNTTNNSIDTWTNHWHIWILLKRLFFHSFFSLQLEQLQLCHLRSDAWSNKC